MSAVVTEEQLENKIRELLSGVEFVKAVDESDGCGAKFEVTIVSRLFKSSICSYANNLHIAYFQENHC